MTGRKGGAMKIIKSSGVVITIFGFLSYYQFFYEVEIPEYSRKDYKHWVDEDRDCQDTRQEVLISESLIEVKLDKKGCRVLSGRWYDPYTNKYFTNPKDLDVDHFVPLKEVHRSGGYEWSKERKQEYANDLKNSETLIAVYKGANRSKSDRDPANWLPKNEKYVCEYVRVWVEIKDRWGLESDKEEVVVIQEVKEGCKNKKVES